MSIKRLYLVILLLLIGCQIDSVGRDEPARPANGTIAKVEPDAQLQLYKEALTNKGSTEQMRINAANLLLFSKDPLAREVLLDVLKQSENSAARAAVCRMLSKAKAGQKSVERSEDFIPPLLEILRTEQEFAIARLAAEAVLLFEYEQIAERLEKMVEPAMPVKARLNGIYALKLQLDMGAAIKLIKLVDDSDKEVAAAAEEALYYLGIPMGADAEARRQIVDGLKQEGREAFLRNRLIRLGDRMRELGDQMRELEAERDLWREQYLTALNRIYDDIKDSEAKGKFLSEYLGSSKKIMRLWALEKVRQDTIGTQPQRLPTKLLGPILIGLISDQYRDVRLQTAKLLSLMGQLNSAEKMLAQHKIERDDEVRTEIFVALGVACSYASRPESPVKISPEVRKETLELASVYLLETDAKKSQKGAEAIKKLLEQDGVIAVDVGKYLGLLGERFQKAKETGDGALCGELLSRMAGLCAQGSACKAEAEKLFGKVFEKALGDESDLVREAAVNGLIYIGKARSLFKKADIVNDPSIEIRKKIVNLAGEVGGKEDLVWLWEKMGSSAESAAAWEAMLKIFTRSEAAVLAEWIDKFKSPGNKEKLADEQMLSVLEIAEQKALVGEGEGKMLIRVRGELAELYRKSGKFDQAAEYFGMLLQAVQTPEEKESILPDLLDAYLRWPNVERAAGLLDNCLLRKDLEPNSPIVLAIDHYFDQPPPGVDPNLVLIELFDKVEPIEPADNRPRWLEYSERWRERLGWTKRLDKPE